MKQDFAEGEYSMALICFCKVTCSTKGCNGCNYKHQVDEILNCAMEPANLHSKDKIFIVKKPN